MSDEFPFKLPSDFKLPSNLPQLSQFTKMFTQFEGTLEKSVRQTGLELPKGPLAQVLNVQKSIESGKPPAPPSAESMKLPGQLQIPALPELPGQTSASKTTTSEVNQQSAEADEPFIAGGSRDTKRSADDPAIF